MRWLRPTHIIGLVETDPKGRYQVENNHVRATYGHSIELSMSLPTDNIPERLYYPAEPDSVEALMKDGLHPGDRTMVHLSKTWNDAYEAGIHREGPDPVILRIDSEDAQNNGIIIQRAGKTVYTVEEIPAEFISLADDEDIELSRKEMMERGIDIDQEGEEEEMDKIPGQDNEGEGEEEEDEDVEEDDLSDEDLEGEDDETDEDLDIEDDEMTDEDLDIEEDEDDN
jgi:putative RNA 2'-phosphotransferase